ncbi:WhiB family transcriptional regulator [Nocardioides nitrophenolicus]|uniref:WhiB family transcriptional regulator n=1 Tax=Nocardioides nitrophenolicus TaxID=60489 RepID=UPI00195B4E8B|nr:WhiB family transcriptional regulator [Nocardioides nitrophenolicus]MBM7517209.1 hypothetical protein [Nocardioides nitrophenolicus]
MEIRNGRMRPTTATTQTVDSAESILNTKGVTVAYDHPTPREATIQWRCVDHEDPEVFDPADDEALAVARDFCGGCEARGLCLLLGTSRDEWGVWGGVLLEGGKPVEKVRQRGRPKKVAAA